jgi:hypothetical protein
MVVSGCVQAVIVQAIRMSRNDLIDVAIMNYPIKQKIAVANAYCNL